VKEIALLDAQARVQVIVVVPALVHIIEILAVALMDTSARLLLVQIHVTILLQVDVANTVQTIVQGV
jgi:hypothetical protein